MAARLTMRVGTLNETHAHVSLWDRGGNAGAIVMDRKTFDAITGFGPGEVERGDQVVVEVSSVSHTPADEPATPRRSTRAGREGGEDG